MIPRGGSSNSSSSALNESPSEKEGKSFAKEEAEAVLMPSMKVPPKRKGNLHPFLHVGFKKP